MPVTNYIWDEVNDTLLMETDEVGNATATYTYEPGQYGPLISQHRGGQSSYYQFDGQGSTRQLTDALGNVTDSYTYTAFGERVASSGTTTNPFGYKGALGYYVNPETSDLYVRARTYSPTICRWLAIDAASNLAADSYQYNGNGPVSLVVQSQPKTLVIEPSPYTPNCHCGQAQMAWQIYPHKEFDFAYLVQKICMYVYAQQCGCDSEAPCVHKGRPSVASKCIYELLGFTLNAPFQRRGDAWGTPFLKAEWPERDVSGEYSNCISVGFSVIWAWIRGTTSDKVTKLPEWQRRDSIIFGGFEWDVSHTPFLESEPAWWSNPTKWKWDFSGSNVMLTAWNCCPRRDKESTHGFMCFSSSSSFGGCRACKGDFESRKP